MRRVCSRTARVCRLGWDRLSYRVGRREPAAEEFVLQRHWAGIGDAGETGRTVAELFPGLADVRASQADLICNHLFDLFGSGLRRLSADGPSYQPLDWHRDFKSGYRWDPDTFYRDIRYGHLRGVDVKVPWELSRFQHLNTLGQACLLTGRAKYRTEFQNQIDDWIRHNPVGFGVNWACTMDVAIRAANWLVSAEHFRAKGGLDVAFLHRFYSSIHEHGTFIRRHLERSGEGTANHYLADIAGLLVIAVCCPSFRESRRWRRFCIRELIREMAGQVYADGCHFEASTCYHRLALELFFFATLLVAVEEGAWAGDDYVAAAERVFGRGYLAKLHAMFIAVLHLLKPNGRMPQIGDNDSGRFLVFGACDVLDMRYLLSLGAVFFRDPQLKVQEFGFAADALWVFGRRGYDIWQRLKGRSVAAISGKAFSDAGWYVMRRHRDYCLVSCGSNGARGRGGHAHNDKLSIELMLDGRDVVVDPGAYLYTSDPDERNRFRATGSHNTVVVDRCEQAELPKDLFHLPDCVRVRRAELTESAGRTGFAGAIEYAGITHNRAVSVDRASGRWSIEDRISSPRPVGAEVVFHLSPHVTSRDRGVFEKDGNVPIACIEAGDIPVETRVYKYSPAYGVAVNAQSLSIRIPESTDVTVRTVLSGQGRDACATTEPGEEPPAPPAVHETAPAAGSSRNPPTRIEVV